MKMKTIMESFERFVKEKRATNLIGTDIEEARINIAKLIDSVLQRPSNNSEINKMLRAKTTGVTKKDTNLLLYLYKRNLIGYMMKNILAENMLRFGVKNLTESNIKRLSEQDPNEPLQPGQEANPLPDTPKSPDKLIDPKEVDIAVVKSKLKGTTANFVSSLLKYNNFLSVAKDGNLLINITGFS